MASINFNPLVDDATGRYGRLVLRRQHGKVVLARPPTQGSGPVSPSLQRVRDRFREAVAYSKGVFADPARRAPYQAEADVRDISVFAIIMTDFLKKPVIRSVETAGYHGQIGDPIDVRTRDDLGIGDVTVTLIGPDDAILETGPAVLGAGVWRYPATTVVALGTALALEVMITDSSGIDLTSRRPLVVA